MKRVPLNSKNIQLVESEIKKHGKRCYYVMYYLIAYCGHELAALLDMKITEIEVSDKEIRFVPNVASRLFPFVFPEEITHELREIIDTRFISNDYLFQSSKGSPINNSNFVGYITALGNKLGIENLTCRKLKGWFGNDGVKVRRTSTNPHVANIPINDVCSCQMEIYKKIMEINAEIPRVVNEISSIEDENERAIRLGKVMSAFSKLHEALN